MLPRRTPTLFLSADLWASAHAQMPARARMAAAHPASVDLVIRATGHHSYNDVGGLASPTVMRAGVRGRRAEDFVAHVAPRVQSEPAAATTTAHHLSPTGPRPARTRWGRCRMPHA